MTRAGQLLADYGTGPNLIAGAALSALVLVLLVRLELRAYRGSELASQV